MFSKLGCPVGKTGCQRAFSPCWTRTAAIGLLFLANAPAALGQMPGYPSSQPGAVKRLPPSQPAPQLIDPTSTTPTPAASLPPGMQPLAADAAPPQLPSGFTPWWQPAADASLLAQGQTVPVAPDGLTLAAVAHSAQVQVFRDTVAVRQWAIQETLGNFDPRAFAEAKYRNTSDPVGSTLTTGGPDRWLDSNVYWSTGVRKRMDSGASIELAQKMGYEDSNSLYFLPAYQGTSRLALSFTQPLLNGAGQAYNCSTTVLAQLEANIAAERFSRDLQTLLLDIHRAYWDLYLQRAALVQRRRLYSQAVTLRDDLQARQGVDVLRGQIARAEAAVAVRQAALIRFQAGIANTEARICALVHDPALGMMPNLEMIPQQKPVCGWMPVDLNTSLLTALRFRPEIQEGIRQIRAASVRADVAANEVLPVLNAVIESYVSGLRGSGDIGQAYADQFSRGQPSYAGGLQFEMPLGGNRTAQARLNQRRFEVRQASCQLEATTTNIRAEVETAVRDVDTAYREMVSKAQAIIACEVDIQYLWARWRNLPGDQQNAGYALDELLSAQERQAQAEYDYVAAESAYNVALISLNRTTGTLLTTEEVCQALVQQRSDWPCGSTTAPDAALPASPTPEVVPTPMSSACRHPAAHSMQ
jgi:outer membrane protein